MVYFQQDNAPAHTERQTSTYLEEISPPDFYLCGQFKSNIFNRFHNLEAIKHKIQPITVSELRRVVDNMKRKIKVYLANDAQDFQRLMLRFITYSVSQKVL